MSKNGRRAIVFIRLKDGVLDPQGLTIHKALTQMGYENVSSVRSGRFFELEIEGEAEIVDRTIHDVCRKLLTNPVIENYSVRFQE